ncbi:hypothetical protein [Micromonospora chalcea]|uniref:hypothetical protein n=1 Tax=Micromonospora chalcea TaxID=1874 RepID=UPI003D732AF6
MHTVHDTPDSPLFLIEPSRTATLFWEGGGVTEHRVFCIRVWPGGRLGAVVDDFAGDPVDVGYYCDPVVEIRFSPGQLSGGAR